jgi:hypothetical protein
MAEIFLAICQLIFLNMELEKMNRKNYYYVLDSYGLSGEMIGMELFKKG